MLCIPAINAPPWLLSGIHQLFTHFEKHTLRIYRQFVRIASGPDKGKMMYTPLKNGKERTITLTVTALNVLREAKRKQNEMHLRAGSSWHNEYNMIFTRSNHSLFSTAQLPWAKDLSLRSLDQMPLTPSSKKVKRYSLAAHSKVHILSVDFLLSRRLAPVSFMYPSAAFFDSASASNLAAYHCQSCRY